MHDSERYRRNAADCLNAARNAREPYYRRLYFLMARSWLSLADQDRTTDELLASWAMVEPIKADGIVLPLAALQEPLPCQQSTKVDRSRRRLLQG